MEVLLVGIFAAVFFIFVSLGIGKLLRSSDEKSENQEMYECGEESISHIEFRFRPRYLSFALLFIIFEIEVAFILPLIFLQSKEEVVAKDMLGLYSWETVLFISIVSLGLWYAIHKKMLEWDHLYLDERISTASNAKIEEVYLNFNAKINKVNSSTYFAQDEQV